MKWGSVGGEDGEGVVNRRPAEAGFLLAGWSRKPRCARRPGLCIIGVLRKPRGDGCSGGETPPPLWQGVRECERREGGTSQTCRTGDGRWWRGQIIRALAGVRAVRPYEVGGSEGVWMGIFFVKIGEKCVKICNFAGVILFEILFDYIIF